MQTKTIPYALVLDQRHNLAALAQTSVINALPLGKKWNAPKNWNERPIFLQVGDVIEAPRASLISRYLEWARVPEAQRNTRRVPPHMFSQWSVPLAMRVLIQNQFGLANLVNLGCDIRINASIRRGERLYLTGDLVSVNENDTRTTLSVRVVTGTRRHSHAIDATVHCMLAKQALPDLAAAKPAPDRQWETAGAWAVDEHDGLRFALLTGDFNPVHWADYAARHSPFGQKVLHGFASLSLSWAALQSRESSDHAIRRISARFVRPVLLPSSSMFVFRSPVRASGSRRYALKNAQGTVFMLGEYGFDLGVS